MKFLCFPLFSIFHVFLVFEQYTSCVVSDNLSPTCPTSSQGTEGERCEWWSEDRETACSVLRCTIISVLSKQTRKQNKNTRYTSPCSKSGQGASDNQRVWVKVEITKTEVSGTPALCVSMSLTTATVQR